MDSASRDRNPRRDVCKLGGGQWNYEYLRTYREIVSRYLERWCWVPAEKVKDKKLISNNYHREIDWICPIGWGYQPEFSAGNGTQSFLAENHLVHIIREFGVHTSIRKDRGTSCQKWTLTRLLTSSSSDPVFGNYYCCPQVKKMLLLRLPPCWSRSHHP